MENIKLRNEAPLDYRSVEELTRNAFWNHHVPGCHEHYLLHIMRNSESFIKELDFVAEIDGKIVANIVYTKSKIMGDNGQFYDVITFGPLSVLPEYNVPMNRDRISGILSEPDIIKDRKLSGK